MKVLGISTSPRVGGNTDLLLDEVLKGAGDKGARVEKINLNSLNINPCRECNGCFAKGICAIKDDVPVIQEKILMNDRLIFASPIYFMAHCAQAKMIIDRSQALWARKYILKKPLFTSPPQPKRKGLFLAIGGTRGEKVFAGAQVTMKYFFDVLEIEYSENLLYERIDEKGAILKHPTAMKDAYEAGKKLTE